MNDQRIHPTQARRKLLGIQSERGGRTSQSEKKVHLETEFIKRYDEATIVAVVLDGPKIEVEKILGMIRKELAETYREK